MQDSKRFYLKDNLLELNKDTVYISIASKGGLWYLRDLTNNQDYFIKRPTRRSEEIKGSPDVRKIAAIRDLFIAFFGGIYKGSSDKDLEVVVIEIGLIHRIGNTIKYLSDCVLGNSSNSRGVDAIKLGKGLSRLRYTNVYITLKTLTNKLQ